MVGQKRIPFTMLQFADDTIFVCKAKTQNIVVLKSILICFEIASGLKVNFNKSKLGSMGVQDNMVQRFSTILNCSVMKVPFKYLGIPVGENHRRKDFWQDMVTKIRKRLAVWKGKYISFVGRVTLLNSVLSSIPLYYLSLFKISVSVGKTIKGIQRDFLWGWGQEGRKIACVKWDLICKSKEEGGLGVKDLKCFNMALLGKWRWRLGKDHTGIWKDILESKYGSWRTLKDVKDSYHES